MAGKSSKPCIVIAEDEPLTGELIMALLEHPGRELVRATDGEMALQMVRKHHPQLVVLDLFMPVRSGLEVLRTLKKEPAWNGESKIMVLSAQDQKGTEEEARRCGADDFLAKPFDPDELTKCVERLLPKEVSTK